MQYTKEQLIKYWNIRIDIEKKEDLIEKGLEVMFDGQHTPFISYCDLDGLLSCLDDELSNVFSYIYYECRNMKNGGSITYEDGKEHKLSGDLKGFIKYAKLEGLIK